MVRCLYGDRGPEVAPLCAWSGVCMEIGDQRLLPFVPGSVKPVTKTLLGTLPDAPPCRVRARTGWPGICILRVNEQV